MAGRAGRVLGMDAAPRPQAEDGEDPVESADSRGVSDLEESRGEANARSLALRNDLLDVNERLEVAQSKMARHGVWALLGLSPIALVPFLGLLAEGRLGLVVALSVLVVLVESWRYTRSKDDVRRLTKVMDHLSAEIAATSESGPE